MERLNESENVIIFQVEKDNMNLKEVLHKEYNISGRFYRKLIKENAIYLNWKHANKKGKVYKGDVIAIVMANEEDGIIPQEIPLDIVYEDYDLLVINKGPNIVVHPTKSHLDNTVANGIKYYYEKNNIKKKIRFINRLDMDTSGILLVAKNPFSHQQIALQFEDDVVIKKYLAIVEGVMENDRDIINASIGRGEEGSIKKEVRKDGKEAITEYKVIERFKNATLLEVQIHTGRSHQIRVHMSYINHPIIGDSLYNKPSKIINRQGLHAYYMKLKQPRTGKAIEFKAQMPEDMRTLLEILRKDEWELFMDYDIGE